MGDIGSVWRCWCGTAHEPGSARCQECLDFEPGYHFRPTPKPWWWESEAIRKQVGYA